MDDRESVVRRYDDLVALFAEDVSHERPGQEPIEGRDALRAFYEEGRPLDEGVTRW